MNNDSLGDRMKAYEEVPRASLMRRTPIILRLDGKAFHTLTKGMDKPYDRSFINCMWITAETLCREIQGVQLAYTQSDEISLLLVDYQTLDTQSWFDAQIQKMVSVSASIATAAFNQVFHRAFPSKGLAYFDSRAFNLPREEVCNYFVWRQQDAIRNSIQMLGQHYYSHKELHGLSCKAIQNKLFTEKGINWAEQAVYKKQGICVLRDPDISWKVDPEIPVFQDRPNYIDRLIYEVEDETEDE